MARPARRANGIGRQGDVKNGTELADEITADALGPDDKGRLRQPQTNAIPLKWGALAFKTELRY
jgi:hypothetical protein